ncbi:carboxypeptidase regulatory-like domain-containing protein [Kaistella flava (ex Peng et al. 2021)]|uniref:Carboxypeptidase regulatory-like domain-containing protein n=1 Tax=Kaistella flava (ex Peng et al. 2021) TaxID=2038776 RepID=A0A7M2YAX8_9FLAO|nr:hypothetical protein [Kaistella flava (ex Peng et al. 2021)]QOW10513.1 carboxypeptidase regulatory-like domain-containing protein [Kaistella flava (ex Peng et al. 2021)]
MKNSILLIAMLLLISCNSRNEDIPLLPSKPTIVSGKVYDFQRNLPVADYLVKVQRSYRTYCGYLSCTKTEEVATTRSDQNGFYKINFDYIIDGSKEEYVYHVIVENANGHIAESVTNLSLEAGKSNVRDVNAWKPIKVKFNLKVNNNNNPPLYIATLLKSGGGTFNNTAVENNGEMSVDLLYKPSAQMYIRFYYFIGGGGVIHSIEREITTNNDDIQNFYFEVDCSKF